MLSFLNDLSLPLLPLNVASKDPSSQDNPQGLLPCKDYCRWVFARYWPNRAPAVTLRHGSGIRP